MPNWKRVIVSGSDAALNSLEITTHLTASGLIYPTADGTDGQVLLTDGNGVLSFQDNVTYVIVKNVSGGTLTKGTPVHSTGTSGNTPEIIPASASLASTMPANFVLAQDISTGAEGRAVLSGFLNGVDTNGFDEGDIVYVAPTGSYTNVKPEGDSNLIQNVAIVGSVGVNGSLFVYGSGRSNDIPNLPEGKIWVGGTNYTVTSSIVDIDETAGVFKVAGDAEITGSLTVTGTSEDIIIEDGSLKLGTSFTQITALAKTSLPSGEALSLRNGTVYITGAGQMGIGTSSPDAELHVNGSARVTDTLYFNADGKKGIKTNTDGLVIAGTSSIQFQSSDATIGNQTERMRITANGISGSVPFSGSFVGDGSGLTGITAEWDGSHNGDAEITGSLVISGSSADLTVTGNAGIGTTSPSARLHVKGSGATSATNALLVENSSGTDLLTVRDDGRVSLLATGFLYFGTTQALAFNAGIELRYGYDASIQKHTFYTNGGTPQLHIANDNEIGIGTESPTAKLNIVGNGATSATTALLVEDSAGTDLLKVEDGGNVGIGMDPVSNRKLAVAGTVLVDASNGINGIMFLRPSDSATMGVLSAPSSGELKIGGGNQDTITIHTHTTEVARFKSSGDVGIGTSSPTARLHISGSSTGDTVLIENNEGSSDAAPVVTLYRNSVTPADGDYLGQLKFKGENDTGGEIVYAKITGKTSDVTNGTEDGLIETAVKKDGANVIVARQTGDALKLINGTGLEVDGTTTLGDLNLTDITVTGTASIAYLDVTFESASVIYSSGSNVFGDADDDVQTLNGDMVVNNTDLFVDASTSRVGITTNTPAHTLDVDSGDIRVSQSGKYLINNSNVGMYRNANDLMLGGYGAIRFLSSATAMPSQTERMIINGSTGNVGIGTSSPSEKLTVEGNISGSGDVNIVGDVTASAFVGDGSALTNITAEWDGSHNGDAEITGSLIVSGSSVELEMFGDIQLRHTTEDAIKFGGAGDLYGESSANSVKLQKPGRSGYFLFGTHTGYFQVSDGTNNILLRAESTPEVSIYSTGALNYTQHSATNNNNGNVLTWSNSTSGNGERGRVSIVGDLRLDDYSSGTASNAVNIENNGDAYFSGSLGIGTTSPGAKLHIIEDQGGASSALKLENKAGANDTGFDIDFKLASSGLSAKIGTIRTNSPGAGDTDMFFSTSTNGATTTEAMRISHDGNVGIGTTSPGVELDVTGQIRASNGLEISGGNINLIDNSRIRLGSGTDLQVYHDGSNSYIADTGTGTLNISSNQINLNASNGENGIQINENADVKIRYDNSVKLQTTSTGVSVTGDLSVTDLTVSGTASIAYIDVQFVSSSIIYSSGSNIFGDADDDVQTLNGDMVVNDTDLFVDASTSRVGIGLSSPLAKLHVKGSNSGATAVANGTLIIEQGSSPSIQLLSANSQAQTIKFGDPQDGDVGRITYSHPTDDMAFFTGGGERMTISGSGDVGIGTSSPSAKLDVEGDINVTNANISNQENTDVDTGTEVVATLAIATYTAGFFDFVIKKGTNVRSGTIYACHDGTSVVHTETTTIDLGDTSDVDLAVDISGGNMRLTATVASDDWSVKSLVRGL